MSDLATDADRFFDLADLACEETASDDEFAELDACLLGNPTFRPPLLELLSNPYWIGLAVPCTSGNRKLLSANRR